MEDKTTRWTTRLIATCVLCSLTFAVSGSEPDETDPSTFSEPDPALHLVVTKSEIYRSPSYHQWVGRVTLTGKLVAEFSRADQAAFKDQPSSEYDPLRDGMTFFIPDEESRKKLPAAIGDYAAVAINVIGLDKRPSDALAMLLKPAEVQKVLFGSAEHYEWPAVLTIKSFSTEISCNHRGYYAEVEAIRSPRPKVLALNDNNFLGC